MFARVKNSKYNAQRYEESGIIFHSKKEAKRYRELLIMFRAGLITDLELQPKFELLPKFTTAAGDKIRAMHYIADFKYTDLRIDRVIVEDVKPAINFKTKEYQIKRKLFLYKYPDYIFDKEGGIDRD